MKPREHETQALIVDALRLAGFTPYETTAYRQKGGSGVDKGIPDILVPIPGLGCYLGIEVKRAGTVRWSSVEQESAYVAGHFVLAQSLEDVTAALISLSCRIPASNKFCEMVSRFEAIVRGCGRG